MWWLLSSLSVLLTWFLGCYGYVRVQGCFRLFFRLLRIGRPHRKDRRNLHRTLPWVTILGAPGGVPIGIGVLVVDVRPEIPCGKHQEFSWHVSVFAC